MDVKTHARHLEIVQMCSAPQNTPNLTPPWPLVFLGHPVF